MQVFTHSTMSFTRQAARLSAGVHRLLELPIGCRA